MNDIPVMDAYAGVTTVTGTAPLTLDIPFDNTDRTFEAVTVASYTPAVGDQVLFVRVAAQAIVVGQVV